MGFLAADPQAWFQGGADEGLKTKVEDADRGPRHRARRQGLARRRPHPRRADGA